MHYKEICLWCGALISQLTTLAAPCTLLGYVRRV
jgi:hypothetical protein